jgi:CHAT domain-containing protein
VKSALTQLASLVAADSGLTAANIAERHPEWVDRDIVLELADSVNRVAREDLSQAERLADATAWLAELANDDFCRARAARSLGNTKVLRGKHPEALVDFERALELFRKVDSPAEQAATLSSALQPLIYLGRCSEAMQKAATAEEIASRVGDELLQGRIAVNFGNILHRMDLFHDAIEHYEKGLEKLTRLNQPRDCAIALVNLAVCHIVVHDFVSAENAYARARELSIRENMPSITAQADYNIAYLYYLRGQYGKAHELYQATRQYCDRVGDQFHSALCDLDQAEMCLDLHLHLEGVQLAQRAATSFHRMGTEYEAAKAAFLLGVGTYQSHKPLRALDSFRKVNERMRAAANEPWVAMLELSQGLIAQQEGRTFEAQRCCRMALSAFQSLCSQRGVADSLMLEARLYLDLDQFESAAATLQKAEALIKRVPNEAALEDAAWLGGQVEEASGQLSRASVSYREALRLRELSPRSGHAGRRKIPHFKKRAELYEAIVGLEGPQNKPEHTIELLEVIEKAKSFEIAELVSFRANSLPSPSQNKSELVEQIRTLREDLNWYYRQTDDLFFKREKRTGSTSEVELQSVICDREKQLFTMLDELRRSDKELHALQQSGIVPISEIQRTLSPDELILEYFVARDVLYAGILGRDVARLLPLTRIFAVRQQVRQLQMVADSFADADTDSMHFHAAAERTLAHLRALYSALIEPIASMFEGKRMVIVPDGLLHYVPFDALYDGSRFLSEMHVVSYAGSASHYSLLNAASPSPHNLGGPSSRTAPSGFTEARDFESLRAGAAGQPMVTHCQFKTRTDNPIFSLLRLGSDEIPVLDLFHMRFSCNVLALTGVGPGVQADASGKELLGLTRALHFAGAKTLIFPLWGVDQHIVDDLLSGLSKHAVGAADLGLAFQQALSELRQLYPNPFDWAAFTLRGLTRPGETQ